MEKINQPFKVRVTRLSVLPENEPLYSEKCTNVSITNESGGEFVEVRQQSGVAQVSYQTIQINPEEWPALQQAIEELIAGCKNND